MDSFKGPRVPILFLLYAGKQAPIRGAIRLQKMVFILKHEYKVSKRSFTALLFKAHRFGMYSAGIQDDVIMLMNLGLIDTDRDEYALDFIENEDQDIQQPVEYRLTSKGVQFVEKIIVETKKQDPERTAKILEACEDVKAKFNGVDVKDLLRYVYQKYPEYIVKSEIVSDVLGSEL